MEPHIEEFVKEARLGVLSTVSPKGRPQSTVVWYAYEDGAFWFNVGEDSQKAHNIAGNRNVALTIDERTWPYKEATVYGRAEEAPFNEDQARRIAIRYVGSADGELMHRAMMAGGPRVRMRPTPERVSWNDFSGWDYKGQAG